MTNGQRVITSLLVLGTLSGCRDRDLETLFWITGELLEHDGHGDAPTPTKKVPLHRTVRIRVCDDTHQNPLPEDAEIWFPDRGSWWIKRSTRGGSAVKNFGRREVWRKYAFHIYPDGRGGREIEVPFMMTKNMKPRGSDRDVIRIVISDDEVVASGSPIEAANPTTAGSGGDLHFVYPASERRFQRFGTREHEPPRAPVVSLWDVDFPHLKYGPGPRISAIATARRGVSWSCRG